MLRTPTTRRLNSWASLIDRFETSHPLRKMSRPVAFKALFQIPAGLTRPKRYDRLTMNLGHAEEQDAPIFTPPNSQRGACCGPYPALPRLAAL